MSKARDIECWLTDMDGVLVHEEQALPGAAESRSYIVMEEVKETLALAIPD